MIERHLTAMNISRNVLKYWMKACMVVRECMRNERVGGELELGIVFEGSFRID